MKGLTQAELVNIIETEHSVKHNALKPLDDREFEVEVKIMRSGDNLRGEAWHDIKTLSKTFCGQPLLCVYKPNKIGEGHNVKETIDPITKKKRYDFTGADAERIIGTIYEAEENVYIKNENGEDWIYARGKIFSFYNESLIQKILNKGKMTVSSEIDGVPIKRLDGTGEDIYVWEALGTTFLGDDVTPAFTGAEIRPTERQLEAYNRAFQTYKIACAMENDSIDDDKLDDNLDDEQNDDDGNNKKNNGKNALQIQEPNKPTKIESKKEGVKKVMALSKNQLIAETQKKFEKHHVIACSDDGNKILLLNKADGMPTAYVTNAEDDGVIVEKRFSPIAPTVNALFSDTEGDGVSVDLDVILNAFSANFVEKITELEKANKTIEVLTNSLAEKTAESEKMKADEIKRRQEETKSVVNTQIEKSEKGLEESKKVNAETVTALLNSIENGKYNNSVDEKGVWNGAIMAQRDYLAEFGMVVTNANSEFQNKNRSFKFEQGNFVQDTGDGIDLGMFMPQE